MNEREFLMEYVGLRGIPAVGCSWNRDAHSAIEIPVIFEPAELVMMTAAYTITRDTEHAEEGFLEQLCWMSRGEEVLSMGADGARITSCSWCFAEWNGIIATYLAKWQVEDLGNAFKVDAEHAADMAFLAIKLMALFAEATGMDIEKISEEWPNVVGHYYPEARRENGT
jgi:hypothetical protein